MIQGSNQVRFIAGLKMGMYILKGGGSAKPNLLMLK